MLKAVTRSARLVDSKIASINADRAASAKQAITVAQFFDHHATEADLDVLVTPEDFLEANSELVPSVSSEELGHYERVRREFEGGRKEDKDGQGQGQGPAQGQSRKPTLEEAEAWQARRIEEMIRSGMGDGSLAKGGDGKGKGKGRMMAFGGSPALNGNGSPDPSEDGGRAQSRDSTVTDETDEGDFVIRTGQMDLNGNGSGGTNGNGHGGGRVRERESRFFGRDREKGKGKEKRAKSRTMGQLFGKGKGKGREEEGENGERDGKREGEFGEAASDKGLYD